MTEDEFRKQVNVQTKQKPYESDLLRVIALAEEALQPLCDAINKDGSTWEEVSITAAAHIREIEQALSEIRKSKGK